MIKLRFAPACYSIKHRTALFFYYVDGGPFGIEMTLAPVQREGKLPQTNKQTKHNTKTRGITSAVLLKKEETYQLGECHHVGRIV